MDLLDWNVDDWNNTPKKKFIAHLYRCHIIQMIGSVSHYVQKNYSSTLSLINRFIVHCGIQISFLYITPNSFGRDQPPFLAFCQKMLFY